MTNTRSYDIVIIGAGPAGSSAALVAAREGTSVLLVERRKVVGVPVRCAEYVPRNLLGELPFRDRSFICQPVRSMTTVLPTGKVKDTKAPGMMIHRDRLDQLLVEAALEQGADLLLETRAIGMEDGHMVLKGPGDCFTRVETKVVIGADGPYSVVRKWMGVPAPRLLPAVQVRVPLVRPMQHTEVYFDARIYGGYGWLFPKGDEANVGLAIAGDSEWSTPLRPMLDWFLGHLKARERVKGRPFDVTAGWIPVAPVSHSVKENMLLVGDAAGQTHPITGAGVPQAIICGYMAGQWAAQAVKENDIGLLKRYEEQWQGDFGEMLDWAHERRKMMEANWDRLEDILPQCWVAYREYYGGVTRKAQAC